MVARGKVALLMSLFGMVLLPFCVHFAAAEDPYVSGEGMAATVERVLAEAEKTEAGADAADGEAQSPEDFKSGAMELQDKLAQLTELLKNKGGSDDPDLDAKLAGLQTQLSSLGVSLGLDGMDPSSIEPGAKDLTAFVAGCVAMSMRRKGVKSPATTGAMRRLAAGISKEKGTTIELVRMIGTCIQHLSDDDYKMYKAGKLMSLPKEMETMAQTSEGKAAVLAMEDSLWQEAVTVAQALVKEMGEDLDTSGRSSGSAASNLGLLALVPILAFGAFLTKKFLDMQKESETKTSGKKAKKQK